MNAAIITTPRDQLEYDYLLRRCGEQQITAAIAALAGARRPFVSNIAKHLQIDIPKDLEPPLPAVSSTRDAERERLRTLKKTIVAAPNFGKAHK